MVYFPWKRQDEDFVRHYLFSTINDNKVFKNGQLFWKLLHIEKVKNNLK